MSSPASRPRPRARVGAVVLGATLFAFSSASFTPLAPFVASGEYARALALAADCSQPFLPALDAADRASTAGFARFAGYQPAGREVAYAYRTLDGRDVHYRVAEAPEYHWVGRAEHTRLEYVETVDGGMTVASQSTPAGCVRLIVKVDPAALQVGLKWTNVVSSQKFLDFTYASPTDPRRTRGENQETEVKTINPDTIKGTVLVRYYENGKVKANQKIYVRADARGLPPAGQGQTLAHEHLFAAGAGANLMPTIRFRERGRLAQVPGGEFELITDANGEAKASISPGYRGGVEAIVARTTPSTGAEVVVARPVVIRHKEGFVHFAKQLGFSRTNPPKGSPAFPYVLTGWTNAHFSNHWVRSDKFTSMHQAFKYIWSHDSLRAKAGGERYLVLNDASLEYGGLFRVSNGNSCSNPNDGKSHATHNVGLDFDISPCYSTGPTNAGRVGAAECESGTPSNRIVKIDERLLAAYIIGMEDGAIFEHRKSRGPNGEPADGVDYHYHIRFADRKAPPPR